MPELPVLKLREVLAALSKLGFSQASRKGNHIKLKKNTGERVWVVIVPSHAEIRKGTLKSIIRQSGATLKEFLEALK